MLRSIMAVVLTLATAFAVRAQGQTLTYGAWQADLGSAAGTEASTVNESGSRFGFVCVMAVNQWTYYVSAHTTCTPGVASTILVNTDAGALVIDNKPARIWEALITTLSKIRRIFTIMS